MGVMVTCQIGYKLRLAMSEGDELYFKLKDPHDRGWGRGRLTALGRKGTFCSDGDFLYLDWGGSVTGIHCQNITLYT